MARPVSLPSLGALVLVAALPACDNAGPAGNGNAASGAAGAASAGPSGSSGSSPGPSEPGGLADASPAPPPRRVMPPRPVPTTSPTVRITMPIDVQLQAIQYMAAMQAPQPDDAPADPAYAKQIAQNLNALGKTDVISSGRRIDVKMASGCNATLPKEAIARRTGASLPTLLAHGVLVVRCLDKELQCLQSTRDADDVLCTHK